MMKWIHANCPAWENFLGNIFMYLMVFSTRGGIEQPESWPLLFVKKKKKIIGAQSQMLIYILATATFMQELELSSCIMD